MTLKSDSLTRREFAQRLLVGAVVVAVAPRVLLDESVEEGLLGMLGPESYQTFADIDGATYPLWQIEVWWAPPGGTWAKYLDRTSSLALS